MSNSFQQSSKDSDIETVYKQGNTIKKVSIHRESYTDILNSSGSPDVTVYPDHIQFQTTYPNTILQNKILISNSGIRTEEISISVQGDPQFTISQSHISLPPGGTYALIATFKPMDVALYSASIAFDGRFPKTIPLTGHCIPSPLEIPPPQSNFWVFTSSANKKVIQFTNKSCVHNLSVVTATDCPAFSVMPSSFEIAAASTADITVTYDPAKPLTPRPTLTVQCPQSGDSISVPLSVTAARPVIVVDFGQTLINNAVTKGINLGRAEAAPNVPWPFALTSEGEIQQNMEFQFLSGSPGEFTSLIKLTNCDLSLRGKAVLPPFSITTNPLTIHNNTGGNMRFRLKGVGVQLSASDLMVPANSSFELTSKPVAGFRGKGGIRVEWNVDGKTMSDEVEINPINEISESSRTELDVKSLTGSSSISMKPSSVQASQELQVPRGLVSFTNSAKDSLIEYESEVPLTITTPKFIQILEQKRNGARFKAIKEGFGFIEMSNGFDTSKVPVMCVENHSKLIVPEKVKLESAARRFVGSIIIRNEGRREGFVTFTAADDSEDVSISPGAAIIKGGASKRFEVSAPGSTHVIAYYCDELIRQVKRVSNPKDYLATCVPSEYELPETAREVIQACKRREVSQLFKSSIESTDIKFIAVDRQAESFTLSPKQIDIKEGDSRAISLINMSPDAEQFEVTADSPFVMVQPLNGTVPSYGSIALNVSLLRQVDSRITVSCAGQTLIANIGNPLQPPSPFKWRNGEKVTNASHQNQNQKQKQRGKNVSSDQYDDDYDYDYDENPKQPKQTPPTSPEQRSLVVPENILLTFPKARIGMLRRASLRVMNHSRNVSHVTVSTEAPFRAPITSFSVDPSSFVLVPVHFTPLEEGKYSSKIVFRTNNGSVASVSLEGECNDE